MSSDEETQKQAVQVRVNQAHNLVTAAEGEQGRLTTELEATNNSILVSTGVINSYDEKAGEETLSLISSAKQAKPQREGELKGLQEELQKTSEAYGRFTADSEKAKKDKRAIEVLKASCDGSEQKVRCSCCGSMVGLAHLEVEIARCDTLIEAAEKEMGIVHLEHDKLRKQSEEVQERLVNIDKFIGDEAVTLGEKQKWEEAKINKANLESHLEQQKEVLAAKVVQVQELVTAKQTEEATLGQITASFVELRQTTEQDIQAANTSLSEINQVLAGADQEKQTLQTLIQETTAAKEAALAEISRSETLIEQSGKVRKEISDLESGSFEKAALIKRLKIIEKIFGMNGVPSLIIERYMPLLNSYVAEYLEIISRGQMRAKMVRRENGELEIEVSGASSTKPFMLSGGEFVKLKLSFSIAMGMLAFVRSSHVPDFICLDEVFSELDKGSKEQVFVAMDKLRERFRDVIVISHDSSLLDRITSTILVNKVDGVCRIEKQLHEV
jgi:DNA repair exonuclease SbcCD ATPase subunit